MVKLRDAFTHKETLCFFVKAGSSYETNVLLGSYIIQYSFGEKWYGSEYMFGDSPDVVYAEADDVFDFYENEDGYMGYVLELYPQPDGNLGETKISAEDFT